MKVLISVLGKPPNKYKVIEWHLESTRPTKAHMPVQVLAQIQRVDHVLLLIPDSLGHGDTYAELHQSAQQLLPETRPRHRAIWHPIVLPSRYSSSVVGDVRDFYRAAIFLLTRWFAEHLSDPNENVNLYLDTSTGLNILQLFTYRAVRYLAGALAFFREVTLHVYNADPVSPNTQHAEIFLTEEHLPMRASLSRVRVESTPRLVELYADGQHPGQDPHYRNIRDTLARQWSGRDVAAFLNAVHYGIPIGIVHWFTEQPEQVFRDLEQIYRYTLDQTRRDPDTGTFLRPTRLGPDVTPYAMGALLSYQLQQQWPFFMPDLKRDGATYEQLRTFMEQMYRHHPVILNRFQAERTIQPENLQCPQYPLLLAECNSSTRCSGSIDRRNFFAHAGFERCAVEVDNIRGIIHFRFASKALQSVQGFLR